MFFLSAMLTVATHAAIQKTTCSYGKLEGCRQWKQLLSVQNFVDKCFSNSYFTHPLFPRSHLQVRVKENQRIWGSHHPFLMCPLKTCIKKQSNGNPGYAGWGRGGKKKKKTSLARGGFQRSITRQLSSWETDEDATVCLSCQH